MGQKELVRSESLRNVVAFTTFEAKRRHGPAQPVTRPPLAACRPISPSSGRISATKLPRSRVPLRLPPCSPICRACFSQCGSGWRRSRGRWRSNATPRTFDGTPNRMRGTPSCMPNHARSQVREHHLSGAQLQASVTWANSQVCATPPHPPCLLDLHARDRTPGKKPIHAARASRARFHAPWLPMLRSFLAGLTSAASTRVCAPCLGALCGRCASPTAPRGPPGRRAARPR